MDKDIINQFEVVPGYTGKVRQIYNVNNQLDISDNPFLILHHSDKCSAFNKYQCDIKNKGLILCETAAWWLKIADILLITIIFIIMDLICYKKCRPLN